MTGDKRTNFAQKRILTRQRFDDTFFAYLQKLVQDVTSKVWHSRRGVFGAATFSGAADVFSLATLPLELLDGDGHLLKLEAAEGASVPFENTVATIYYVGARHVEIPSGVVRNPRTGVVNYDTMEDRIGEKADPDSVTEAAGQLTFVVDSVFEAGVTHAGRKVTVYLKNPVFSDEDVAIERDLTVVWDGSNNKVTCSGVLGQQVGSASTSPSDYTVVAQGLTVRKTTLDVAPYVFFGTVQGAGAGNPPTVFNTSSQQNVADGIDSSLDEAYDNSAPTHHILVDAGPVDLRGDAGSAVTLQVKNTAGNPAFKIANSGKPTILAGEDWDISTLGLHDLDDSFGTRVDMFGEPFQKLEPIGRIARTHTFEDDFTGYLGWTLGNPPAMRYEEAIEPSVGASGSPGTRLFSGSEAPGGIVEVKSPNGAVSDFTRLLGPASFKVKQNSTPVLNSPARLRFKARLALDSVSDRLDYVGLIDTTASPSERIIAFYRDNTQTYWRLYVDDGTTSWSWGLTSSDPTANTLQDFYLAIASDTDIRVFVAGMPSPQQIDITSQGITPFSDAATWDRLLRLYVHVQPQSTPATKRSWLDYWRTWDNIILGN